MSQCEVCGNDYYLSFKVVTAGSEHTFDCFECAIHKLAPVCSHCGCKIIGHGIEAKATFYCCANCAKLAGVKGARDNVLDPISQTAESRLSETSGGHLL